MNNILIIIINYANENEVLDYVKMISKQELSNIIDIVIVENKSGNKLDLLEQLKNINVRIKIFKPKKNLGYLGGALYGYGKFIKTELYKPNWIIISNTDIYIPSTRFFNNFIKSKYDDNIVCIAPSVFSTSTNSYQNPYYKKRLKKSKINRIMLINKIYPLAYIYSKVALLKSKFTQKRKQESCYVYSAHGCFFILKNGFIENIYKKGYDGFLYGEELYIAECIIQNNKRCFYDSSLDVVHYENAVTKFLNIKNRSKYIYNSLKFIKESFYTD